MRIFLYVVKLEELDSVYLDIFYYNLTINFWFYFMGILYFCIVIYYIMYFNLFRKFYVGYIFWFRIFKIF